MKKTVIAALLAATMAGGSAQAADLILLQPEPIATFAPAFSWTGFYVGANVGYGWGNVATSLPGTPNYATQGVAGGLHAGYNYDFGGFVLGAEADFSLGNIRYDAVFAPGISTTLAVENFGSIRARAGLPLDRFMPYVTGGVAIGSALATVTNPVQTVSERQTFVGWTAGLGTEYAVSDNILLRAEFLYTDLGSRTFFAATPPGLTDRVNFGTLRAGVSVKF